MRNYSAQLWLGAWLLVLPFLGIPGSWKEALTALTALILIGHALAAYYRRRMDTLSQGAEKPPEGSVKPPNALDSHFHLPAQAGGNDAA